MSALVLIQLAPHGQASETLQTDYKPFSIVATVDNSFIAVAPSDNLSLIPVEDHIKVSSIESATSVSNAVLANFYACKMQTCDNGFAVAALPLSPFVGYDKGLAGAFKQFYPSRYRLTAPGLAPLTWAVMTGVFALAGFAIRGRVNERAEIQARSKPRLYERRPYEPVLNQAYRLDPFNHIDPPVFPVAFRDLAQSRRPVDDVGSSYLDLVQPIARSAKLEEIDLPSEAGADEFLVEYRVFILVNGTVDSCHTFDAPHDAAALMQVRTRKPMQSFELWRGNVRVLRQSPLKGPSEIF